MTLGESVEREIARCRRNLALGGSPEFWCRRWGEWADEIERAAIELRGEMARIKPGGGTSNG